MNSLRITGNAGKDPVSRTTKSGKAMASFSLAHTEGKDDQKKTIWFDVLAFDDLAEEVMDKVQKGKYLLVEGKFSIEEYEKRDGTTGIAYKVLCNNIVFDPARKSDQATEKSDDFSDVGF
jgi:single-strand DNA-binding protein